MPEEKLNKPTKKEIRKYLSKGHEYAHFVQATRQGLEYYAQVLFPGYDGLLVVNFVIPLNEIGYKQFKSIMPAAALEKFMTTGED